MSKAKEPTSGDPATPAPVFTYRCVQYLGNGQYGKPFDIKGTSPRMAARAFCQSRGFPANAVTMASHTKFSIGALDYHLSPVIDEQAS